MKILIVQLLRLGDILQLGPLVAALRAKHSQAEIHLLVNSQFAMVAPFFPNVKFHYFPRNDIQKAIGDRNVSSFLAVDIITELVAQLNANNYDLIVNLTQNQLSAWLCSSLEAKEKIGLHFNEHDKILFGSPWFRYMNDQVALCQDTKFHYLDIFAQALGVTPNPNFRWPISLRDRSDSTKSGRKSIVFQAFTSEDKKNWHTLAWVELGRQLLKHQDHEVVLLSAPGEQAQNQKIVDGIGVRSRVAVCSLEGAVSILNDADLLITTDTSIKHLAVGTRVPVVELNFGSADFTRQGAYKENVVMIQAGLDCQPCSHSSACVRASRDCANLISPERVLFESLRLLGIQATAPKDTVRVYQTFRDCFGLWDYKTVAISNGENVEFVQKLLEKSAWLELLNRDTERPFTRSGSVARSISEQLQSLKVVLDRDALAQFKGYLKSLSHMQNWLETTEKRVRRSHSAGDFRDEMVSARSRIEASEMARWKSALGRVLVEMERTHSQESHLGWLRQYQILFQDLHSVSESQFRIGDQLMNYVMEA